MATYKDLVDRAQAIAAGDAVAATFSGRGPDGREYMIRVYDSGGISIEIDGLSYGKPAAAWWDLANAE